jgi:hypothetical protein
MDASGFGLGSQSGLFCLNLRFSSLSTKSETRLGRHTSNGAQHDLLFKLFTMIIITVL